MPSKTESDVLTFRSRHKSFPPSRYVGKLLVFSILAIVFYLLYLGGFPSFGCAVCFSLLFIWIIVAAVMASGVEYFRYTMDNQKICLSAECSNSIASAFWNGLFAVSSLYYLRRSPCYKFSEVADMKESTIDGFRILILYVRHPIVSFIKGRFRVHLPEEDADAIVKKIRSRIPKKRIKAG